MERETEKLVAEAHSKITRINGQEYSPTADEIVNQINKMTGVQWLVMRYHQRQGVLRDEDIEKAKEVEQAHIVKAYSSGSNDRLHNFINEQYYNETFKKSN